MIPVLGVPVLSRPEMLEEMLATIDVEIGQLIVIDNGGVVDDANGRLIIRPEQNLGVAGSWNKIVATAPDAPWWAIMNFDLLFAPGDLGRLTEHMEKQRDGMVALLGTFSAFALDRAALDRAGSFDENFHPAYFEDNDYDYRCRLTGVAMVSLPTGLVHRVSSTIHSHRTYARENARTFPHNYAYYREKWGGPPLGERFTTPFDAGGSPAHWELDQERLALLAWDRV